MLFYIFFIIYIMRFSKDLTGNYNINGKKYQMIEGSRAQVYHGTAYETSGGLKKKDLIKNKHDRIVSKKKHTTAKKEKRLLKNGYGFKKGTFGFVKLDSKQMKKKGTKKHKGGYYLTPGNFPSSVGMTDSTSPNATNGHITGGGNYLNPSQYPFGKYDDPSGAGSLSHQSFLEAPNNTPLDVALLAGGKKRKGTRKNNMSYMTYLANGGNIKTKI